MQDRTVLIVTHCAEIAQLLAQVLEAGGYVPDATARADALLRTAAITHPALVLLDCDHECVRQIDALPSPVRSAIALFSPSRLPDEVRLVADRFDVPYVSLPAEPRRLLQFVRGAIGSGRNSGRVALSDSGLGGECVTGDSSSAA